MCDVLFLTNNENAYELYEWIKERVSTVLFEEKLTIDILEKYRPSFVVSYNYRYIVNAECIEYMKGHIINLHISYLPWNRGSSPNIWSFIDDTPKGVTIHQMSAGLDEGGILFQRKVEFDAQKDTLSSSYEKLNKEIKELFKEHWDELFNGDAKPYRQDGQGSYHTMKDLAVFREKVSFEWSDRICDFSKKVSEAGMEIKNGIQSIG